MNTVQHTLAIGATGMLRDAVIELTQSSVHTTVIGRSSARLNALKKETKSSINTHILDYTHGSFQNSLRICLRPHGPVERALLWVHTSQAPTLLAELGRSLHEQTPEGATCEVCVVLSSAVANPMSDALEKLRALFETCPRLAVYFVVLGFVLDRGRARWLSHEEISGGVIDAFSSLSPVSVVGVVEPWDARP